VRTHLGTSGYAYPEWYGTFYPEDLPKSRMLRHYASRFATVETNSTFTRLPSPKSLANWMKHTPEEFVFAIKAPRAITHHRRLDDARALVAELVDATAALGAKRGPFLFQLPPNFKKDVPRLAAFLAELPRGVRAAFEFRHASWFDDDVYAALRARGAALVLAESEELSTPIVATADWGYARLRRDGYGPRALAAWAQTIRAQPWSDAFVYFKHEDEGRGPKLAARLGKLLG
jgi:uncharacterized protein YecE (DUF72 family)